MAICPSCRQDNPDAFRLCGYCGASLTAAAAPAASAALVSCPSCGEENPARFKLCGFCGATLARAAEAHEVRKTVTIVFSDLKGSTSLGETLDSEALREVMHRYFAEMQRVLERHHGTVEKFIGDAVMAVFGLPTVHEDDALRAVRAAWDMKEALARLNDELERRWGVTLANRTGVNTGEVVASTAGGNQRLATGDAVNVAARLEQAAPALEVLIGESTYRLVRDAVDVEAVEPLALKGKAERVPAYRLLGVRSGAMFDRRLSAAIVGRDAELATLRSALAGARAERVTRTVTISAHAGVGKTRLLAEFARRVADEATIVRGQCLPYGDGITFWPLAEVARAAAGISGGDPPGMARDRVIALTATGGARLSARVMSIMGLSAEDFPIEELFWAARRLLELLAATRPLVVVFEDAHWGEPTFLDLVAHLAGSSGSPILVVITTRPDLLERREGFGSWTGGVVMPLAPLSSDQSVLVAENLLGSALDAGVRRRIVEAAEGNPLFVEQMLSMLIDDSLIERVDGVWRATADLSQVAVPPTIQALLAARLDRLQGDERSTIEPAAVVGRSFPRGAVERMSALGPVRVDSALGGLIRKEFVTPSAVPIVGGESFAFGHALIRDAAYRGLLKRRRADLHEAYVDWLADAAPDRLSEQEEIVGYHLEQAHRYRAELGPLDEHGRALGQRAGLVLRSAGRRAFARGDMPAAANLLGRAHRLVADDREAELELVPELAEVLIELGRFDDAESLLAQAEKRAVAAGHVLRRCEIALARLVNRYSTAPDDPTAEVSAEAERAIAVFSELGHHAGLAKAWRLLGILHGTACRFGDAEVAVENTIRHALLAGDELLAVRNYPSYAITALYGPLPVPRALERCEQVLDSAGGDQRAEGVVLCAIAHLRAEIGDFDGARIAYRRAQALLDDLGVKVLAASTALTGGPIEMLAGDPAAAEEELRRGCELLEQMQERYLLSTMTALLAEAVVAQGRLEEADLLARRCEVMAMADDVESHSLVNRVRGRIRLAEGAYADAERLARAGLRLAERTDNPVLRGDAWVDLGETLLHGGDAAQAASALRAAVQLYEAKGSTISVQRAQERLRGVAAVA